MSPNLYVIAGPNGAGKTTFAREFLPNQVDCKHFINADFIAAGLSPFSPETAAIRAGRLMLEEIERQARTGEDFSFETTLSGRSYVQLFHRLMQQGYRTRLYFMWIPDAELSLWRIRGRVAEGGHDIPEAVVRRRFDRSLRNFWTLYRPLAESWTVYDNSGLTFEEVVFEERGGDWDASTQVWKIARPGAPIISNPKRYNEFLAKVATL